MYLGMNWFFEVDHLKSEHRNHGIGLHHVFP